MAIYQIENQLKPHLIPNEVLVWSGKPKTGIIFRGSDLYLIPFSILWCGFAIFWETMVISSNAPFFFWIWGIPFILVGLYLTVGRFFIDAKKRENTVYGLTNERIIIISGIFSRNVKSLNIKTLTDVSFTEKADRSGTITLGTAAMGQTLLQGTDWPGVKHTPQLEFIEDVKNVYAKIIFLQRP
ncbi:MAG: PH domain-containing protein [Bacteroidia bacterium]|jgi:hypothetical protein|nr:PH domain-containing protein [Bacteroidia bacterium]